MYGTVLTGEWQDLVKKKIMCKFEVAPLILMLTLTYVLMDNFCPCLDIIPIINTNIFI